VPDDVITKRFQTMLHNPAITVPNSICYWLGNGDVQSVIMRLVVNDVEITDTQHYATWLRERWDLVRAAKANESRKFVTQKHIQAEDLQFMESITVDDPEVYALLSKQIDASPQGAVFGKDIIDIEKYN
jgi:hypothetical protein